jgi:hypothetical protein
LRAVRNRALVRLRELQSFYGRLSPRFASRAAHKSEFIGRASSSVRYASWALTSRFTACFIGRCRGGGFKDGSQLKLCQAVPTLNMAQASRASAGLVPSSTAPAFKVCASSGLIKSIRSGAVSWLRLQFKQSQKHSASTTARLTRRCTRPPRLRFATARGRVNLGVRR